MLNNNIKIRVLDGKLEAWSGSMDLSVAY